jgi:outer membrane lipoprotein-sorting protein
MRQPSRWRAEVDLPSEGVTRLQVTDGPRWWLYDPRRGVETNAAAARPESSPRPIEAATADAFDPAPVIPTLWLEPRGPTRQAGRSTIRVRGVPREGAGDPVRWPGADEYELLVDADRGVLLRFAASLEGEEFAAIELERVVFDEELPDTLFAFALPVDAGGQRR